MMEASSQQQEGGDEQKECPVCLRSEKNQADDELILLRTSPCHHIVCQACLERILLCLSDTPTRGQCPICRGSISLFDLFKHDKELAYPPRVTSPNDWELHGFVYGEQSNSGANDSYVFDFSGEIPMIRQSETDYSQSFDSFHWHGKSRTFQGVLDFAISTDAVVLQFTYDLAFISRGSVIRYLKDVDKTQSRENQRVRRLDGVFKRVDASFSPPENVTITYIENDLWGNTFCQGLKQGLASYHFLSSSNGQQEQQQAYISYDHVLCAQHHWPPLDDGTPIPSRVYFTNVSFSAEERIFRGSIEWLQEHGTTWQGCQRWRYEMKFDTAYTCILGGSVISFFSQDEQRREDVSTFGVDLLYVNAAIGDKLITLDSMKDLEERLVEEGASVLTVAIMYHALDVAATTSNN